MEKNVDRKHFLYTKKGHKFIGLKNREKAKFDERELVDALKKVGDVSKNVQKMYDQYDSLISF